MSKYPPTLFTLINTSGIPIAFIVNGAPIFSPFTFMIFPSHSIDDVVTNLCSFIEIASAPAFFSSFTTLIKSASWTINKLGSANPIA